MSPPSPTYELIEHTADFGVRVYGPSAKALFANAARALFDLITDRNRLAGRTRRVLSVSGEDRADLMVNWLRELLFLWNGDSLLVKKVDLTALSDCELTATVFCDRYAPERHPIHTEIKAVTYHQIRVEHGSAGWEATVIFDV